MIRAILVLIDSCRTMRVFDLTNYDSRFVPEFADYNTCRNSMGDT